MSLTKINSLGITLVYYDLGDDEGFYRILPDIEPYICLNSKLLEGNDDVHQAIYQTLLEYHQSIPLDSPYRLFPLIRYYSEIAPDSDKANIGVTKTKKKPELVLIGRAKRTWTWPVYFPINFRVIGEVNKRA